MNNTKPIELLEAERRIKASQVGDLGITKTNDGLEPALERLGKTLASVKRVPDDRIQIEEQRRTTAKLREFWNAPIRHVTRTEFNPEPREWWLCLGSLSDRLGKGFTAALVGLRGPGKTQIGVELMKASTTYGRSAYYCTAMDYFTRLRDAMHKDRKESGEDAQKFFIKPRLLVIDEMNVRSDSVFEDNMLADLIGKRYNGLLDTVLISNETAPEFAKSVGPSIVDRLNETGGVVECTWKSFRQ